MVPQDLGPFPSDSVLQFDDSFPDEDRGEQVRERKWVLTKCNLEELNEQNPICGGNFSSMGARYKKAIQHLLTPLPEEDMLDNAHFDELCNNVFETGLKICGHSAFEDLRLLRSCQHDQTRPRFLFRPSSIGKVGTIHRRSRRPENGNPCSRPEHLRVGELQFDMAANVIEQLRVDYETAVVSPQSANADF